ncbi:MAG TPA: MotA/TolQ/ExbB proton channel family protein [Myxococcota bacterium]|nr:MotA/TolQ/ExbB proton channel family protein [Myxococcota bacterium]HRY93180.1 MotA/TolQ/ExbB proton channel family protein [Myxococcota bacterium]
MTGMILQALAAETSQSFMIRLVKWLNPLFEPVVLAVLLLLLAMSAACWGIIYYKWRFLRRAQQQSVEFLETFWGSKRLDAIYSTSEKLTRSPIAKVFRAGYEELAKLKKTQAEGVEGAGGISDVLGGGIENVQRSLRRTSLAELTTMESLVPFLATTGSAAPFIGLFGTVVGIMKAFVEIRPGTATLEATGPGISHALIATAVGLLAAIPAVMAYNYFVRRIKVLSNEMETFSSDFTNIVKRHFLK